MRLPFSPSLVVFASRVWAMLAVAGLGFLPNSIRGADLEFAGNFYQLVNVSVDKDGVVSNDYMQLGENDTNWTSFLSVRYWPKAKRVQEAASPWLKRVQTLLVKETAAFSAKGAKDDNDVVVEAWLAPEDLSYLEIDLHRFVIEPGSKGVRGYLFGRRTPAKDGKLDPGPYLERRQYYFDSLSALKIEVVKEKP